MKHVREVIPNVAAELIQKQAEEIEDLQRLLAQAEMHVEELESQLAEERGERDG